MRKKVFLCVVFGFFYTVSFSQNLTPETFKERFNSIRRSIPDSLTYLIQRADSLMEESKLEGNNEFITRSNYLLGLLYYFNSQYYISQQYYLSGAENPYLESNLD
ncbi:MAG: hypothetical protein GW809_02840 [Bacteroidetes bacterium]|nr:hypothetical protein [Bacteroidota bacterium]